MINQILSQLNPSQREAVEYNDGPSLVIAGAGSGKTRVLTYKIAYLIACGMQPWNILALTFTNKAAGEMKKRIAKIVGEEQARHIHMGTFHSIFSRILRVEAAHIGFDPQFTIYDESDSRSLIKAIVKEMGLDDKTYKSSVVHHSISMAKNNIVSAQQYLNDAELFEHDRQARIPAVGKIYVAYQQRLKTANAMDFDDLLMLTYRLFADHNDIRQKWVERLHFVLVDEYQDTNKVQQMIVEQLTRERHRVCVVGDDAQSIYAFRGANIDNILEFNSVYPEARLFKLEQNYRSTQRIVKAANSLIKHNVRQIPKDVFSENDEGERLQLKMAYSDTEEAMIVCNEIKRLRKTEKCEFSDFAILYRTNAQSRSFEEQFMKQGIPYKVYGGLSFYQRKEIKDIIAYFRLVVNSDDEEAFKRIINYPTRGIGPTTVNKIADTAQHYSTSFWNVCFAPWRYQLQVNAGTAKKLEQFSSMIMSFKDRLETTDAYQLGHDIIKESGISTDLFSSSDPEYVSRQENLEEFMAALQDFVEGMREEGRAEDATLTGFLQTVSLQADKTSDNNEEAQVSLMTVHAAKGTEYPTVFVVGMEENIFPSQMASQSAKELEEERRLLYVAITRAEKHCILTCAKNRWRYGKMEFDVPSRFLQEIDRRYLQCDDTQSTTSSPVRKSATRGGFRGGYSEVDTPYRGFSVHGDDYPEYDGRVQNSRPVAAQFRADKEYKITTPRRKDPEVDPFTPAFRRKLEAAKSGGMRPVATASRVKNTGATLAEGMTIEHERFGVGTVVKVEGTGDNAKATVQFKNTGTKQLLLKFAKYKVVG